MGNYGEGIGDRYWGYWGSEGTYFVWFHYDSGTRQTIWNVTKTRDIPPATTGGYPSLDSLLKLKGIK
jgi:hypothetical protein